jgi:hypothetical protein
MDSVEERTIVQQLLKHLANTRVRSALKQIMSRS